MQDLFDLIPEAFFSLLASKNKRIYFRALMVLRDCYQQELRFHRGDLIVYLVHHMESDLLALLAETDENPDQPPQESDSTLSGRAHMMIRRFLETGWLRAVPDEGSLDELLLVPDFAIALLDVLHDILHPVDKPYNSFVYSTYSALRTANEERDYMFPALQSAYDNTQALKSSLRALLDNIYKFYQSLQKRQHIRGLLAEHFDEYQALVAAKTYHPLKTVDSVHRFRPRILAILRDWLQDGEVLDALVQSLQTHRGGLDAGDARYEVIRMIQSITDSLEGMDSFLREIDRRNTAYSRASVERIQYLLNTDRDTKGKLVEILKHAPKLHSGTLDGELSTEHDHAGALLTAMSHLPIYRVEYADPDGLYTEPVRRERGKPQPLAASSNAQDALFAAEAQELIERSNTLFSHERIIEFIVRQMSADGILHAQDLRLYEVEDFLRTMMAVIKSDEADVPYDLSWDEAAGQVVIGGYRLPAMTFAKREVYP